jgi:hypothetical protein
VAIPLVSDYRRGAAEMSHMLLSMRERAIGR